MDLPLFVGDCGSGGGGDDGFCRILTYIYIHMYILFMPTHTCIHIPWNIALRVRHFNLLSFNFMPFYVQPAVVVATAIAVVAVVVTTVVVVALCHESFPSALRYFVAVFYDLRSTFFTLHSMETLHNPRIARTWSGGWRWWRRSGRKLATPF